MQVRARTEVIGYICSVLVSYALRIHQGTRTAAACQALDITNGPTNPKSVCRLGNSGVRLHIKVRKSSFELISVHESSHKDNIPRKPRDRD